MAAEDRIDAPAAQQGGQQRRFSAATGPEGGQPLGRDPRRHRPLQRLGVWQQPGVVQGSGAEGHRLGQLAGANRQQQSCAGQALVGQGLQIHQQPVGWAAEQGPHQPQQQRLGRLRPAGPIRYLLLLLPHLLLTLLLLQGFS